jgi:hypothetical protein
LITLVTPFDIKVPGARFLAGPMQLITTLHPAIARSMLGESISHPGEKSRATPSSTTFLPVAPEAPITAIRASRALGDHLKLEALSGCGGTEEPSRLRC